MSPDSLEKILEAASRKLEQSISLVEASLDGLPPYDADRDYSPKEAEPYDALCDRFIRAVESAVRFFRARERFDFVVPSDTYRDLLLRMEKGDRISSVSLWIEMRDLRNRIVHDYLPGQVAGIHEDIRERFAPELFRLLARIRNSGPDDGAPA